MKLMVDKKKIKNLTAEVQRLRVELDSQKVLADQLVVAIDRWRGLALKAREALKEIKHMKLEKIDGGPEDMTENEKMYCHAVGKANGIASNVLSAFPSDGDSK